MIFDRKHFKANLLPHQFIEKIELANKLNDELKAIVKLELQNGNFITDVSIGFPNEGSILISLQKPFLIAHSYSENITYQTLTDPHYWQAEYASQNPVHLVVCPFNA